MFIIARDDTCISEEVLSLAATKPLIRTEGITLWWFRVQGSGFRVQGSGFRVQGSGWAHLMVSIRLPEGARRLQRLHVLVLPPDKMPLQPLRRHNVPLAAGPCQVHPDSSLRRTRESPSHATQWIGIEGVYNSCSVLRRLIFLEYAPRPYLHRPRRSSFPRLAPRHERAHPHAPPAFRARGQRLAAPSLRWSTEEAELWSIFKNRVCRAPCAWAAPIAACSASPRGSPSNAPPPPPSPPGNFASLGHGPLLVAPFLALNFV
jgi:hypothetical protein